MNDESLQRANAFLAAVSERVAVGEVLQETPAEIGRVLGLPDPLSTARAVRALIARRRLEAANGSYRLLDAKALDPGERESIGRRPRRAKSARPATGAVRGGGAAYSDLGRAVADKLVDLGREAAELRAEVRTLREDAREARSARDESERRSRTLSERSRELESRAEMAESNLRSLLATARSGGNTARHDAPVGDAEMAAILGVLRGDEGYENGQGGPEAADITEPASVVEPADVVAQPPTAAG
jgi:succinate dehydrogenase/fumarate reductase flavoprotein subunit